MFRGHVFTDCLNKKQGDSEVEWRWKDVSAPPTHPVFGEPRLGHGMMNAASVAAAGGNAQSVRMSVYEPNDETVENLGDTCPFRKSQ